MFVSTASILVMSVALVPEILILLFNLNWFRYEFICLMTCFKSETLRHECNVEEFWKMDENGSVRKWTGIPFMSTRLASSVSNDIFLLNTVNLVNLW